MSCCNPWSAEPAGVTGKESDRSIGASRGHRRRDGTVGPARQGPALGSVRRGRKRSAGRTRCIPLLLWKMNFRCCIAAKRKRPAARPSNSISLSSPTLRSAAVPPGLPETDTRRRHPWFAPRNLAHNMELVRRIEMLAKEKGCAVGQLALAWLLAQGQDVVPSPGTKRKERLWEKYGGTVGQPYRS
jgi:hypothetical protein